VRFLASANEPRQFVPDIGAEVAVAGRSNAGKSSAINAIVQRKGLARTSKTPGATRLINFFELAPGRRLVDLPGYGFAAVSGELRSHWADLVGSYFRRRQALRGVLVVMDVRHPLTEHDRDMLGLGLARPVPVHVLLTKSDKLGRGVARQALAQVRKELADSASVQLFSALGGEGVAEARGALERMLGGKAQKETPTGSLDPAGVIKPGVGG
jgi:GTP-binding protein